MVATGLDGAEAAAGSNPIVAFPLLAYGSGQSTIALNPFTLMFYLGIYGVAYFAFYKFVTPRLKNSDSVHLRSTALLVLVIFVVLIDIIVSAIVAQYSAEKFDKVYVILFNITNIMCCMLALYIQFSVALVRRLESDLAAVENLRKREAAQYELMKDNINRIDIKCHDLKHRIRSIGVNSSIDPEAVEEIEKLIVVYDSRVQTGNKALDVILTEKSLLCNDEGITLSCIADGAQLSFMTDGDIYSLFGNLVDNAIEAVMKLDRELRSVSLSVKSSSGLVHIGIYNRYEGDIKFENGLPVTTKNNTIDHGYGMKSVRMLAEILAGTVSPSGRLTDTFVYDIASDPTWANNVTDGSQITYAENIYIGYRWYETADAEGYFDDVSNSYGTGYDGTVQYPFGYGLSYTTFDRVTESTEWIVDGVGSKASDGDVFKNPKTTVKFSVKVTNTGDVPGKDVVQLYVTPPYTRGGIEKAHVTLAAFAKTDTLYPADYEIPEDGDPEDYPTSQTVTLSFDLYDIASYDCYDANNNGVYGYELDPGDYVFKLMDNAHANDPTIQDYDITWKVPNMGTVSAPFGYTYRFDPDTKGYVTNRFTGDTSLYKPVDGSTGGEPVNYMTRENFAASFPTSRTPNRSGVAVNQSGWYNGYDSDADLPMLPLGQDNGLYLFTLESGNKASLNDLERSGNKIVPNEELIMQLGKDYDDELWDKVLAQLSIEEISRFIASAGFGTKALESVGKPKFVDKDGPAGFNGSVIGGGMDIWTGYACENLVGMSWNTDIAYEFGAALATEGQQTGVDGNYGVCVNLHRTSVNTRNFEAFSEDPLLSGKMAARLLVGATTRGMYVYLKHLALSEPGQNPNNLNTWLTEQTLREIYLKSFEIAVKEGEANAVMSAFNRVGGVNANENYTLLTTVLRDEWKFEGCVITDYGMGDPKTFIRSGGDIKLNPNDGDAGLSASNKADVYCGVRAVKNVLYTYCNTYYRAKTFDPTRVVEITEIEKAFRWWILALVGLNVVIFGLITWQGIMIALRIRKDRKNMMTSNV